MVKIKTKSDTVVQSKTISKLLEAVNKTLTKTNQLLTDDAKEKAKTKKTTSSTNSTKYKAGEVPLGVELTDAVVQPKARKDIGNLFWSYALGMDPAFAQLLGLDRVGKVLGKAISPKIFDPFNKNSWKKRTKNINTSEDDTVEEKDDSSNKKETYGSAVKKSNSLTAKFTDFFTWMKSDKNKKETKQEKEKEQDSLLKTLLKLGALGLLAGLIVKALSSSSILSNIKAFMDGALSKGLGLGAAGLAISDALPGALIGAKLGGIHGALIGAAISLGYNSINRSVKDFEKRSKAAENGEYQEPANLPGGFTPNTFAGALSGAIAGFMVGGIPGALAGAALGLAGGWIVNKVQEEQLKEKANMVAGKKALNKEKDNSASTDPLNKIGQAQWEDIKSKAISKYIDLDKEQKELEAQRQKLIDDARLHPEKYRNSPENRGKYDQQMAILDAKISKRFVAKRDMDMAYDKTLKEVGKFSRADLNQDSQITLQELEKFYLDNINKKDGLSEGVFNKYRTLLQQRGNSMSTSDMAVLLSKKYGLHDEKININEALKSSIIQNGGTYGDYNFISTQSKLSSETTTNTHQLNINNGKLETLNDEITSLTKILELQVKQKELELSMSKDGFKTVNIFGNSIPTNESGEMSLANNSWNTNNNVLETTQGSQQG